MLFGKSALSILPQRRRGIEGRRAEGGQKARRGGDGGEAGDGDRKRQGVARLQTEEQRTGRSGADESQEALTQEAVAQDTLERGLSGGRGIRLRN